MEKIRQWKIWPPVFYTLVWTIGFFIGIFGFLQNAEGPLKLIVGAFTAYGIFLMNACIDFWIFLVRNLSYQIKPLVAYIFLALGLVTFATILLSYIYVNTESIQIFSLISALMILSFFVMEYIKANEHTCVIEIQGSCYKSNL